MPKKRVLSERDQNLLRELQTKVEEMTTRLARNELKIWLLTYGDLPGIKREVLAAQMILLSLERPGKAVGRAK